MPFNKLGVLLVTLIFSQLSFSAACPTSDTATATGASDGDSCTVTDADTGTITQLNFVSGFDSSTSVTAVDGNNGTTVGAQRKLSFIKAAELVSARVDTDVTLIVDASFSALSCTTNSAVLGSAGASANVNAGGSPPSGILANMYYPIGLYNAITGSDASGAFNDIAASFNSDIGDADCLAASAWYYGFSDAGGSEIGFTTVLIHELTHGLGFASLVDPSDGTQSNSTDDIFSENLYDDVTDRGWNDNSQTDQNREDSAISVDDLLWSGSNVNTNAIGLLTDGFNDVDADGNFESGDQVEMYAPATLESGSSVSHFTTDATPNEIMEPSYTDSLYELGLALYLLEDIGWTIVEPNNAPTITAVDQTTPEDTAIVVDISGWGSDDDGDALTYSVTSCATNITCSVSGTDLTLTPSSNHNGATHTITVKVDDGTDNSSDSFNLNVTAQNDAPTWSTISEQNTNEDNDLIIDLTGYATDVDGDSLTFSVTSCATNITCSVSGDNLTLSPTANYSGATHNITVEADDNTASAVSTSFNLVVNAQNDAPTWSAIPDQNLDDGDNVVINLNTYASDIDGDSLDYTATSCGANLTCSITTNSLTVTASGGAGNTVSVTIEADDNNGGTNSDTFDVTITTPANNAPTITAVDQTTTEDNAIVVDISSWGNDADGDGLTYSVTSCASNITCSISGTNLTLTPDSNHNGATHSITIKVDDGTDNNSDSFNLNVSAANDAPTWSAIPDQNLDDGDNVVINLNTYASDIDGDSLDYTATSCGANLTCSITTNSLTVTASGGAGNTVSVTIEADDNNGGTNSDTFDVTITTPANNAPTITAVDQTTTEDNAIVVDISSWGNDADGDGLTYSVTSCASNITCSISGTNLTLTPDSNHNGATHSITIKVDDGTDNNSDSFNLNVSAANDAPTWSAIPDQNLDDGDNVVINLNTYASDIDGDSLDYTATSCGANLTCSITTNSLTVTASGGAGNTVSVTIEADDNNGGTNSDTFDVTITTPANNAPTITAVDQTTTEDNAIVVDISSWGNDADGDGLTYSVTSCASNITCSISGTNLTLTPDSNHNGATHSITIKVDDGTDNNSDSFNLNVSAANDAPTWSAIPDQNLDDGDNVVINLNTYASDIDGDSLDYTATSCGANLTCSITTNSLTVTASGGAGNTVSVTIEADDNNGGTSSDTFDVTITTPANNAPTITAEDQTTSEDTALVVDISAWGSDAENDSLSYSLTSCAENITCALSGTSLTLTPDANHHGSNQSITIEVSDPDSASASDTFNLNVVSVNDAPTFSDMDDINLIEGESVSLDLLDFASDIDGDALSFSLLSCPSALVCSLTNSSLSLQANSGAASSVQVSVQALDANGASVSKAINVNISAFSASTYIEVSGTRYDHNDTFSIPVSDINISVLGGSGDYEYQLNYLSGDVNNLIESDATELTIQMPEAGAFAGQYTLSITDTSNSETIVVTLIRPIRVVWSASDLLSGDNSQDIIIEGGEVGSQYSLAQLQDTLLTFKDAENVIQTQFTASDDQDSFNGATVTVNVGTVTTLTDLDVTISTLNNLYEDEITELQIYPAIEHQIHVVDINAAPIPQANAELTATALLSQLNLPLQYSADENGEMTIRLPDTQAVNQLTIQSNQFNPATLMLDESLTEHQVILSALNQFITLTGSISALGTQNFISHPPQVRLDFEDGSIDSVTVSVSNSSQASFSHDVDINNRSLTNMRVIQADSLNIELDISSVTQNQTYNILLERSIAVVVSTPSSGSGPFNLLILLGLTFALISRKRSWQA